MSDEILKILRNYYPSNVESNINEYFDTQEFKRFKALLSAVQDRMSHWNDFLVSLRTHFSNKYEIEDWTQFFNFDASYICRLSYSSIDNILIDVVINVSVIADYYAIYSSKIIRIEEKYTLPIIDHDLCEISGEVISGVTEVLKIYFPDHIQFPKELIGKTIPDLSLGNKNFGNVTFFDCMFTTHVW